MSLVERIAAFVSKRRLLTIGLVVLLTVGIGYGAVNVEQQQSLDQFESDSVPAEKLSYIQDNFGGGGDENTTTVQVVIRNESGNVLSRSSLLRTLELQQRIRDNETINETLTDRPFGDLSNFVATTAIRQDIGAEIRAQRASLNETRAELRSERTDLREQREAFNRTARDLSGILNRTAELQGRYDALNASLQRGEINQSVYRVRADAIQSNFSALTDRTQSLLEGPEVDRFQTLRTEMRALTAERAAVRAQFQQGAIDESTRDRRLAEIDESTAALYQRIPSDVLADRRTALQERGQRVRSLASDLESQGDEIRNLTAQLSEQPSLSAQRERLEEMNASEVESVLGTLLGEDGPRGAFAFVPRDFEQGSTTADARMLFITQVADVSEMQGSAPDKVIDTQLGIQSTVADLFGDRAFVFGSGVVSDEINRSFTDSISIVTPLALLFVVLTLTIAYRDPIDIFLGTLGIALVLVWTFGFMGWVGFDFNQIFISVPVLLIGLSIDYAIHVFMRQREQRGPDDSAAEGMNLALAGIGVALIWVTLTAVIGFLSNVVSPIPPIRNFGITSGFGVLSALVIFGTLIPALKVSIDNGLERMDAWLAGRGPDAIKFWPLTGLYDSVFDRRKQAFGTGGGPLSKLLSGGRVIADKAPIALVVIVLLITAGATASATTIDTSFSQNDFLADDPPDWLKDNLPESVAPGDYSIKQNIEFVNENFLRDDFQSQVLIEENGTDVDTPEALAGMQRAQESAEDTDVIVVLSDGNADVRSPLTVMQATARDNESFGQAFRAADTNGDEVPDRNVTALYDRLFETAPDQASQVVARDGDGGYEAARLIFSVDGSATSGEIREGTEDVADAFAVEGMTATATGQQIVFSIIEDDLLNTVIQSLLITLGLVAVFLIAVYRVYEDSATLGLVTMLPIALSVAWILGTMALLGIPFNVITGTITSLTIGLGIAYNIHMSERFRLERGRGHGVWESLELAVTGTGGALVGSAATTIGGFGVLAFAIIPVLQQFGIVTGLTIAYAFLGSVLVLPSMLVLWSKYVDPDAAGEFASEGDDDTGGDAAAAGAAAAGGSDDGGAPATDVGGERSIPTRYVEPGDEVLVDIELTGLEGRAALIEHLAGGDATITDVTPEPEDVVVTDRTLFAVWEFEEPSAVELTYRDIVPETATDGQQRPVRGFVRTAGATTSLDGDNEITVVTDLIQRLRAQETVTTTDLRLANRYAESGDVRAEELEAVYERWLAGDPDTEPEPILRRETAGDAPGRNGDTADDAESTGSPESETADAADGHADAADGETDTSGADGEAPATDESEWSPVSDDGGADADTAASDDGDTEAGESATDDDGDEAARAARDLFESAETDGEDDDQ